MFEWIIGKKLYEAAESAVEKKAEEAAESIYANTDKAQTILKKMRAKGEEIRGQEAKLEQLSTATEDCWGGLSGDALREKLAELVREQAAIAEELEKNTGTMAQALQQLEDEDRALGHSFWDILQRLW